MVWNAAVRVTKDTAIPTVRRRRIVPSRPLDSPPKDCVSLLIRIQHLPPSNSQHNLTTESQSSQSQVQLRDHNPDSRIIAPLQNQQQYIPSTQPFA